jgi:hypothetical protein
MKNAMEEMGFLRLGCFLSRRRRRCAHVIMTVWKMAEQALYVVMTHS